MITHWKGEREPKAPYYAVIFISVQGDQDKSYHQLDEYLLNKAQEWEGYLGCSSVSKDGKGIFISYWQSKRAIESWKNHDRHLEAKNKAHQGWYQYYHSLVCLVESSHIFEQQFR